MSSPQKNARTKQEMGTKSEAQPSHFYSQLKKIPGSLLELNHFPPLGKYGDFPFEKLSQKLNETFGISSLNLEAGTWTLRSKDHLKNDLGGNLICLHFALSPLEGPLYCLISKQDLLSFASKIFLKNGSPSIALESYLDACIAFFSAEIIHAFESLSFNENFHPQLLETRDFPTEDMMTTDIMIHLPSYKATARILFSKNLQNSLRKASIREKNDSVLSSPLAEQIEVILSLEAGNVRLSQEEWRNVKTGDLIILDQSSFKPNQSDGEVVLSLNGRPLCKALVEAGKVKILEHPEVI